MKIENIEMIGRAERNNIESSLSRRKLKSYLSAVGVAGIVIPREDIISEIFRTISAIIGIGNIASWEWPPRVPSNRNFKFEDVSGLGSTGIDYRARTGHERCASTIENNLL